MRMSFMSASSVHESDSSNVPEYMYVVFSPQLSTCLKLVLYSTLPSRAVFTPFIYSAGRSGVLMLITPILPLFSMAVGRTSAASLHAASKCAA